MSLSLLSRTRRSLLAPALSLALLSSGFLAPELSQAASYKTATGDPSGLYSIDPDHTSVTFTIGHAGVATAVGRFDKISGHYRLSKDKTDVEINIASDSIDTNHAMRDKDLRGPDFLDAKTFPSIRFVSHSYQKTGKKTGVLKGKLTLHGVTRTVRLKVHEVGAGLVSALPKPWGGYLSGYDAEGTIKRSDYGVTTYPGMIGDTMHLYISVEGIRSQN